jgi:hypothetical protein
MVAPFKVGGMPAAPACALHKLRWGSDPLFSEKADIEDEVHDETPPASGGMKRTLTKTSITLNTEDERSKKYHSGEEPGKGWVAPKKDSKKGVCPKALDDALREAQQSPQKVYRGHSGGLSKSASESSEGGWGFYKDCEGTPGDSAYRLDAAALEKRETPDYVLEDTLEMQALWHATAGARPAQPLHERKRFEDLWARQNETSCAVRDFKASPEKQAQEKDVRILCRDASPFGTSVTKSWRCECCGELTSIMVRIPKIQIVQRGKERPHAEFLVVARLGAVTFGLWRRYSHFEALNDKVAKNFRREDYTNTHWSWRCLRRRQRWFRCLDRDYLALKCFLLERFLHDLVFEAHHSGVFAEFFELDIAEGGHA